MIIKRKKSDDETCFSHPPSCPGLVIRHTWFGPKSPNQVCRIQKLPQESNLKCRKDLREALRLDRQQRNQEHVVSFHVKACLWDKIIRVTLKARGVQETLKCGPGKKRHEKIRMVLFSACLGKPRVHAKGRSEYQKINSDTMNASWKYRSTLRRWIFRYGRDFVASSMQAALHKDPGTKRIWNYSKFLNLRTSMVCSELREWWLKEIQKKKNVFPADIARTQGKNRYCKKNKQSSGQKTRVYVYSDSVLCLGKQHGPEDAISRWNDHQVSTLKMYPTFRELQGLDGDPIDYEWKIVPRSQSIGKSPEKIKQTHKERTSHLKHSVIE